MKYSAVILISFVALFGLNSVSAQDSGMVIDCVEEPVELGEEARCFIQEFPSDFNWSDYDYEWSLDNGDIVSDSVESVTFVPEDNSEKEANLKVSVTDGNGETFSQQTSAKLESEQESKLSEFEVECREEVRTGSETNCKVEWRSDKNSDLDYSWNVDGPGSINGDTESAIYTPPKSLNGEESVEAVIRFSAYTSSNRNQDKQEVKIIADQKDNSSNINSPGNDSEEKSDGNYTLPVENESEEEKQSKKKIERLQEKNEEQKSRINKLTTTVERQKETIQNLREKLENINESNRENQEETSNEPVNNTSVQEEPERETEEDFDQKEDDVRTNRTNEDSRSGGFEEAQNQTDEEIQNQEDEETNQSETGFLETIRSIFG